MDAKLKPFFQCKCHSLVEMWIPGDVVAPLLQGQGHRIGSCGPGAATGSDQLGACQGGSPEQEGAAEPALKSHPGSLAEERTHFRPSKPAAAVRLPSAQRPGAGAQPPCVYLKEGNQWSWKPGCRAREGGERRSPQQNESKPRKQIPGLPMTAPGRSFWPASPRN